MTAVGGDSRRGLRNLLKDAAQGTTQLIRQEGRLTLLESKRLFQALAWTPRDAYQLVREIPLLEECGSPATSHVVPG